MDSVVLSWILRTTTIELQVIVRERGGTTRQARIAIEEQFINNHEAHALWQAEPQDKYLCHLCFISFS